MDRRWRPPLTGGVCWLGAIVGAMLLGRIHWGTEHTGMLLIGFASGLFTGSLFSAIIPKQWPGSPRIPITLLLIYSIGGIQRSLAAHNDLYLILPAGFIGGACGMAVTLWYLARVTGAADGKDPEIRSSDPSQERR